MLGGRGPAHATRQDRPRATGRSAQVRVTAEAQQGERERDLNLSAYSAYIPTYIHVGTMYVWDTYILSTCICPGMVDLRSSVQLLRFYDHLHVSTWQPGNRGKESPSSSNRNVQDRRKGKEKPIHTKQRKNKLWCRILNHSRQGRPLVEPPSRPSDERSGRAWTEKA